MDFEGVVPRLIGNFIAILFVSYGFSGISVTSAGVAILAAIILGFINAFLKPFLFFVTLPVNILSLGLFTLVINAFMLKVVDWFLPGFTVKGFLTAIFGALTISVVSTIISLLVWGHGGGRDRIH